MPRSAGDRAGRGLAVRLAAAAAVAASLVLLLSPLCHDGMAGMLPTAMVGEAAATEATATPSARSEQHQLCPVGTSAQTQCPLSGIGWAGDVAGTSAPQPHEVMVACVAVIAAVLVALRAVQPPPPCHAAREPRTAATPHRQPWPGRATSRAELCVLRA